MGPILRLIVAATPKRHREGRQLDLSREATAVFAVPQQPSTPPATSPSAHVHPLQVLLMLFASAIGPIATVMTDQPGPAICGVILLGCPERPA